VVEWLIKMLNWKNLHKQYIQKAAADIVYNLVKKKHNSVWVAWIPEALEFVTSLLYNTK
ncbi:hypothetical protein KI387_008284, partial [Taxus chinensis]